VELLSERSTQLHAIKRSLVTQVADLSARAPIHRPPTAWRTFALATLASARDNRGRPGAKRHMIDAAHRLTA
jgi:hypothetical protein